MGTFEVQVAKRWDSTGLELYAIATQSQAAALVGGGSAAEEMQHSGGELAVAPSGKKSVPHQVDTPSIATDAVVESSTIQGTSTHRRPSFSLPADTESAIVTKIVEILGFWVAGDDVNLDTFEHRDLLAKEIAELHSSASKALSDLWRIAAPNHSPTLQFDEDRKQDGRMLVGSTIGAALTDMSPLPLPVLPVL